MFKEIGSEREVQPFSSDLCTQAALYPVRHVTPVRGEGRTAPCKYKSSWENPNVQGTQYKVSMHFCVHFQFTTE